MTGHVPPPHSPRKRCFRSPVDSGGEHNGPLYLIVLMTLAFTLEMSFRESFGLAAADGEEQ